MGLSLIPTCSQLLPPPPPPARIFPRVNIVKEEEGELHDIFTEVAMFYEGYQKLKKIGILFTIKFPDL